jgi:hypothetical protein
MSCQTSSEVSDKQQDAYYSTIDDQYLSIDDVGLDASTGLASARERNSIDLALLTAAVRYNGRTNDVTISQSSEDFSRLYITLCAC